MLIDTLAYTNRLRAAHPGEKMLFALCTLFGALLTDSIGILGAIAIGMMLVTILKIGIAPRVYGKLLLIPATFIVMGAIPLLIETGHLSDAAVVSFNIAGYWLYVTLASFQRCSVIILKSLASISCFYVLVLSTPVNDVLYLLGKIGVPALLVEMMSLVYRYLSVFVETVSQMYLAQKSRQGYSSFSKALKSLGILASTIFIRALLKSSAAYNALLARGYRGEIATLKDMRPINRRAVAQILWGELVLFALIAWNSVQ
ncbi:cobalt ABC transporter, inner membrane subunit CbiQ [Candidatus Moduliflexus flocculans]|uniref:Cobalt ABC transporter, inner membrane subunit CbiQ n=1 Tax=Candidatus Moduliflexus flocculans TaxID=1499966 RepID=A0A081BTK4_9BACT|nr:cobalt ABC transporter, inner membrane subunit CbiQ [Candidatus Moduliflexus flocculans]